MVRRGIAAAACCLLVLMFLMPAALADRPMVIDNADLYTADQIAEMEEIITRIREKYQIDVVVLTTNDVPLGTDSVTVEYADHWFEENGYGIGEDRAGAVLITDMTNRFNYISTMGIMIDYMTSGRIEQVLSAWDRYGKENQGRAMIAELQMIEKLLAKGIEEGQFRFDEKTGKRLTRLFNKLTKGEALFGVASGVGVGAIIMSVINGRYKLKHSTYRYNSDENAKLQLTDDREVLIGQKVTHTRIVSENKGGGGGGGLGGFSGSGRGSGVHISSGGHTHGGGGHHF